MSTSTAFPSKGLALIADPIYDYIPFTVGNADAPDEVTEKDLIDTPWMQRLRRVFEIDLRSCPRCGDGTVRVIAAIT